MISLHSVKLNAVIMSHHKRSPGEIGIKQITNEEADWSKTMNLNRKKGLVINVEQKKKPLDERTKTVRQQQQTDKE